MNAENHTTGAGEQKLNAETPVPTAEPFIDKREVARRMGRTVRAVDKMMRKGILPYYRFDWQVAFRWSEVEAQLARTCRVPAGREMNKDENNKSRALTRRGYGEEKQDNQK